MPELPEVETTLRGIKPHIVDQKIVDVSIRHAQLRWPIPADLKKRLQGQTISAVKRRAKYLLFFVQNGCFILHLGMSGRLHIIKNPGLPGKHDHVDIYFGNHYCLRFTDPRRFGALLWAGNNINNHRLLVNIGPEPLGASFNGNYLFEKSRNRKVAVKSFVMNSHIVAGVGNIYATEALFQARLHPQKAAGEISLKEYERLANAIKEILKNAVKKGGTTLKDFMKSDGTPGYFSISLKAYGRHGKICPHCKKTLLETFRIANRATVFCPTCQRL